MSRSTIAQRKSSPCCIGCIVLLLIAIGLSLAVGIYMYKFAKNNLSITNVAAKMDPPLDTPADKLLPPRAGAFERTALMDTLENVPEWQDVATSSSHVAIYKDPEGHQMTVIAVSTQETREQRQTGSGLLTMGRSKAGASDTAVTIKDTFSGPGTRMITTWSKPNWTFMIQTSSTLMSQFMDDFHPGGEPDSITTGTVNGDIETGNVSSAVPEASAPAEPTATPVVPQGEASLAAQSARAEAEAETEAQDRQTTQP